MSATNVEGCFSSMNREVTIELELIVALMVICLFLGIIFGAAVVSIDTSNVESIDTSNVECENYSNVFISSLPVRCLEYYGITNKLGIGK